jgi:hypothetical protein
MALDPEIQALVVAAEGGQALPEITVMTGGVLVIGRPAPPQAFVAAARQAKLDELTAKLSPAGGWRGLTKVNKDEARREAARLADESLRMLGGIDEVESLTLVDAKLIPDQGNGLQLPAIRIPAASIDAWWIGVGRVIKAPASAFLAVSMPLPG